MRHKHVLATLASVVSVGTPALGAFNIVDTLGLATPDTVFRTPGSGGTVISAPDSFLGMQSVGPLFALDKATRITEIGGFLDLHTAGTSPFTVQIRPVLDGLPDPGRLLR